jgi:hypothetical protein
LEFRGKADLLAEVPKGGGPLVAICGVNVRKNGRWASSNILLALPCRYVTRGEMDGHSAFTLDDPAQERIHDRRGGCAST